MPDLCSELGVWISIHAPRGGSDIQFVAKGQGKGISIHAPRGGSDLHPTCWSKSRAIISIHAPRGGSDGWACAH